ncbi:MAG: BamA/TamA family outer membrane protein, partial [Sutterella sp.]
GAGAGIRWNSPVGPVKLDLAVPVGDPDKSDLQFYIGLGSEL